MQDLTEKYQKKNIHLQKKNRKLLIIYKKIIILLNNLSNKPSKFRTINWVEINDELCGTYNLNSQMTFKISMPKSRLCDYNNTYMFPKGTITTTAAGANKAAKERDDKDKKVISKNCASLTDWISETNNTQVDYAKYLNFVMLMNILIIIQKNMNVYGNITEVNQMLL